MRIFLGAKRLVICHVVLQRIDHLMKGTAKGAQNVTLMPGRALNVFCNSLFRSLVAVQWHVRPVSICYCGKPLGGEMIDMQIKSGTRSKQVTLTKAKY